MNSNIPQVIGRFRESRLTKLAAYYVLIGVSLILTMQLFVELQQSFILEEFTKLTELIADELNVTAKVDDVLVAILSLVAAFLFVVPVAWVYVITKQEEGYDQSIVQTIVVLAIVVAGAMMIIQDSLARAFGLVAVVAAVRFRTTMKDTKDAVYVFLALAIGMAAGLGLNHVALFMSIFVNGIFLMLWKFRVGNIIADQEMRTMRLPTATRELPSGRGKKDRTIQPFMQESIAAQTNEQRQKVVERQGRLLHLVNVLSERNKGKKKANAVLVIQAAKSGEAQNRAEAALNEHARVWELAGISTVNSGQSTLEYILRLNKGTLPSTFMEALVQRAGSSVRGVEFQTLKSGKKQKHAAPVEDNE